MGVRIHVLAKDVGIPAKELLDFINKRKGTYGFTDDFKTVSSSIPSLYVDVIVADIQKEREKASEPVEAAAVSELAKEPEVAATPDTRAPEAEAKPESNAKVEDLDSGKTPDAKSEEKAEAKAEAREKSKQEAKPQDSGANVNQELKPVPSAPEKPAEAAAVVAENKPADTAKRPAPTPKMPPLISKRPPSVPPVARFAPRPQTPPPPQPKKLPEKPKAPEPEVVIREAPRPANVPPVLPPRPNAPKTPSLPPRIGFGAKAPGVPPRIPFGKPQPQQGRESEAVASNSAEPQKPRVIQIKPPIIVRDFAKAMDVKSFRLISELMDMGIFASMNQTIEEDVAIKIAERHGFELDIKHRGENQARQQQAELEKLERKRAEEEDAKNLEPRPPIVCILGHVDHGKTTLLDTILHTNVVAGEAGGITQHTAAYQVELNGKKITFIDTPGHAAFSKMRERGANVTDIAILVVAADDGFMPQTDEALAFAQKAGVPVVVAINKMDAKGANMDKVKQQMQKRGIAPEDWGGETLCCGISALKGEHIEDLLELVLLQAEMMEIKANPKRDVEGVIIESQIEQGRGSTATVIVKAGTLKPGDVVVSKGNWCKVRAMMDSRGAKLQKATPGTPALLMGWSGAPEAGDEFKKVKNDKVARQMVEDYETERKKQLAAQNVDKPVSIEDLMAAIENKDHKVFKCIVKSDVSGTVEALVACLEGIKSDKVALEVIGSSVGQITKNDVEFASTASASIVAFNVKQENGVAGLAKHEGVEIITHNIIYELINQVRDAMKNLLEPELRENKLGAAEVRQVFNVSKGGKVAGCMVTEGIVKRDKHVRVLRAGKEISKGRVADLKRFKEDVSEVRAGYECGMSVSGFSDYQPGDIFECFEILEIRPDL